MKSIYLLVGRERRKQTQRTDSLLADFAADKATLKAAETRSTAIFRVYLADKRQLITVPMLQVLDVNGTGFLTVGDFEQLFRERLRSTRCSYTVA